MFPLLSALRRNPLMPRLIVLQVMVASAILCNTLFLLGQQAAPLLVDDGLAGDELVIVDQLVSRGAPWTPTQVRAGRDALASIAGVRAASAASGVPMRQTLTLAFELKSADGTMLATTGYVGERLLETFGLRLTRGRDFLDTEYRDIRMADDMHTPIIHHRSAGAGVAGGCRSRWSNVAVERRQRQLQGRGCRRPSHALPAVGT